RHREGGGWTEADQGIRLTRLKGQLFLRKGLTLQTRQVIFVGAAATTTTRAGESPDTRGEKTQGKGKRMPISRHGWRAALVLSALAALLSSPGASDAVFATPPLLGGLTEADAELARTAMGTAAVSPPPRRSCAETSLFAVVGGATAEAEEAAIAAGMSGELSATERPSGDNYLG
ncbi:unnamed protein product, partial [Ectocarpus sp. 12 AP-2014]